MIIIQFREKSRIENLALTNTFSSLSFRTMEKDILLELNHDLLRRGINKYTTKAFQMLPELEKPRILDIGCGSGIPTLELARLSKGEIIGIDIDQSLLDKLTKKIKEAGLAERVKTMKCSLLNMKFPDESFDIIWTEGGIFVIGFEKGIKEWRRFIKPNGFLIVHDEIGEIPKKLKTISVCGYKLIEHFVIPEDIWWNEYYCPLEKRIQKLRKKYRDDPDALAILDKEQHWVDEFKKNPKYHGSVFFVMQKSGVKSLL